MHGSKELHFPVAFLSNQARPDRDLREPTPENDESLASHVAHPFGRYSNSGASVRDTLMRCHKQP